MSTPRIGAQLYTIREHTQTLDDFAASMAKIAEIGYTAVQISAIGPIDPGDVAKAVGDNGLAVAATHVGWGRCREDLDGLVAEHKLWGCTHMAIGGLPGEYFNGDGVKRFLDELAPVSEKLKAAEMDFSYHNHNHELARYGDDTWLGRLYDQADPALLKAEIDTYWITAGGGSPVAWINRCAGREPLLHVKDMAVTPAREAQMAPIGQGNLNWPAILDAARAAEVEEVLVEQDQCYDRDPFDCLADSYRFLKGFGLK